MRRHPDATLVATLSREIDRVVAGLVRPGERVALVNFPNHANAGDPALWLGELAALRRAGAKVVYTASWASYHPDTLRRALGDGGTILLHGGGNFGDLYLHNQATTRERVLRDFPRRRTIQLPQSIWFREPVHRERLRRLCEAHADFTLLVREAQSLALARAHFGVPSLLCPDMAFALGTCPRAAAPSVDVLWLARGDVERRGWDVPAASGVAVLDWLAPVPDEPAWPLPARLVARLNRRLHVAATQEPPRSELVRRTLAATFRPMARAWVSRGCRILARGRVVVTDRLHGHILALLQGIPHVVLDNSYGKLRSTVQTWTHRSATASWAETPDEALALARGLAAREAA
jgi:pyruvyl transferase EpsO